MSSSRANQKRNLSSDNSFETGENKGTVKKPVTKPDPKRSKHNQGKEMEKQQTMTELFSQDATASNVLPDYDLQFNIEQLGIIIKKTNL